MVKYWLLQDGTRVEEFETYEEALDAQGFAEHNSYCGGEEIDWTIEKEIPAKNGKEDRE